MPKDEIDYSKTIIYKIICKDKKVSDVYVGHTTNFIKRKFQHKTLCKNLNNKLKIYEIIRQNGGWDNWEMIEIRTYNCKNKDEARIKEQQHYEELKPSLNSCPPYVNPFKYDCNICGTKCCTQYDIDNHIKTQKHKTNILNINTTNATNIALNATHLMPENAELFNCCFCNFKCSKKSNYEKHLLTLKHKNATNIASNAIFFEAKNAKHIKCSNCEKVFNHSSSMYRHKKDCKGKNEVQNTNNNDKLVEYLMKENSELKHMIIDVCKNVNSNSSQNNHSFNNTNSHNKTFNLQFFLNETCKDAMNLMDFVESVKLQLSDLEKVGEIGYVNGISNLIVKNLNALDETKRPVHCTDTKREVLYIKDEDKWEKEDEEKKKMRKLIKKVADKNARLIPEFKKEHPDCVKAASKFSDQYNKIIVESFDNDSEKEDKIIKKIAKEVTINKVNL